MTNAVARALVLTGALLGVLACEDSLLEPAAIDAAYIDVMANQNAPVSVSYWALDMTGTAAEISCEDGTASGLIDLEGGLDIRTTFVATPDGGTRLVSTGQGANLSGINNATGETYRARELTRENFSDAMGYSGTMRVAVDMFGVNNMNRFRFVQTLHDAVNANGEVSVNKTGLEAVCRV